MPPPTDIVLGLDGGGTKTLLAAAGRDGQLRAWARGAGLDPVADPAWPTSLHDLLARCRPWSGQPADAVLGLPWHGEAAGVSDAQRAAASRLLPGPHVVINDGEAAFDGALAGAPGVLLLAGTGSMAWAGNGRDTIRCGGWGDVFGDEGSAFWIGREALGEATRALDGRSREARFAERLLALLGLEPDGLLPWCVTLPARRSAVAALALHIDTLAESGEPAACAVLRRAGDALATHARACVDRLGLPPDVPWSFAGSVFRSRTVMARVTDRLGRPPRPPRLPPVGGALLRAAGRAGWAIDDTWIERLGRALSEQEAQHSSGA